MHIPRVARRYAEALYDEVPEDPGTGRFLADLTDLRSSLAASRELQLLFQSPIIPFAKKRDIFDELFRARVHPYTYRVLEFLLHKRREHILAGIIEAVFDVDRRVRGIATAAVTSVLPIDTGQRDRLAAVLEGVSHSPVEISWHTDPALIGGLVARVGDRVYDGSIRRQLARLRRQFGA